MKIYFVDGDLDIYWRNHFNGIVDAKYGLSYVKDSFDSYKDFGWNFIIYTNSILAFNNDYVWNEELQAPELYLNIGKDNCKEWVRIDKLTDKEIRREHNLMKMYLAGGFDNVCYNM